MELTPDQTINLVAALKAYRGSKVQYEHAQKNMNMKLDKLKTCCGGSGNEAQVMEKVNQLLAEVYLKLPEVPGGDM